MSQTSPAVSAGAQRAHRLAAFSVAYYLGVILWGAWVRIAKAGNGCGSHWPTCNGEILPLEGGTKTLIEFTHRVTSGAAGVLGVVLLVLVWRAYRERRVRWAAGGQFVFLMIEALVGRLLVKRELVAEDDSIERAVVMAFHLVNTFGLMAATFFTAWWTRPSLASAPPESAAGRSGGAVGLGVWVSALVLVVVSMSGAVTALGDTIFPPGARAEAGFLERVNHVGDGDMHFLIRLLVIHPLLAVAGALLVGFMAALNLAGPTRPAALRLIGLVAAQTAMGVLNVTLGAPGWAQVVHLLLAQLIWLGLVELGLRRREAPATPA